MFKNYTGIKSRWFSGQLLRRRADNSRQQQCTCHAALLLSLILTLVLLGVLGATLASLLSSSQATNLTSYDEARAYYLAESGKAGVEAGVLANSDAIYFIAGGSFEINSSSEKVIGRVIPAVNALAAQQVLAYNRQQVQDDVVLDLPGSAPDDNSDYDNPVEFIGEKYGPDQNGVEGGAFEFNANNLGDNVTNYIRVEDSEALQLTTAGTISLWIYPTANNNQNAYLVHKPFNNGTAYALKFESNQEVSLVIGNSSGVTNKVTTHNTRLRRNTGWYHVVGVWDQTTMAIYVNGVRVDHRPNSIVAAASTEPLFIGAGQDTGINPGQTNYPYNGYMADVKIFKRALIHSEIIALYNP